MDSLLLLLLASLFIFADFTHAVDDSFCANGPAIIDGDKIKELFVGDRLILSCCVIRHRETVAGLSWTTPQAERVGYLGANSPGQNMFSLLDSDGKRQTALLVINSVSAAHSGDFVCRDDENAAAAAVGVLVRDRAVLQAAAQQWVKAGAASDATCRGQAGVAISWFRERQRLPTGNNGAAPVWADGNHLRFERVSFSDAGLYVCKGELPTGGRAEQLAVKVVTVNVYQTPIIVAGPATLRPDNKAVEHKTNEFYCDVMSQPQAQVEWLVDGKTVDLTTAEFAYSSRQLPGQQKTVRSILKVFNFMNGLQPALLKRVPTFQCRAELRIDAAAVVETVAKQLTPAVIYKPRITEKSLLRSSPRVGSVASLSCRAQGADPQDIRLRFERGAKRVANNGLSGRLQLQVESDSNYARLSMRIFDVQPEDSGNYTCIASTDAGTNSYTGSIEVQYSPSIVQPLAPSSQYSWYQHDTVLKCVCRSYPEPEFKWFLNGEEISESNDSPFTMTASGGSQQQEFVTEIRFTPEVADDRVYGRYECSAMNDIGSAKSAAMLVLEARRPGIPDLQVDAMSSSPTSLSFDLLPPADTGGVALIGYELYYSVNGGPEVGPSMISLQPRLRIRYLKPLTNYRIFVAARNVVGSGGRAEVNYKTGSLSAPKHFSLVADFVSDDPTAFLLRWRLMNSGGLPVNRYRIRIRRVEAIRRHGGFSVTRPLSDWWTLSPNLGPNQEKFLIESLRPNSHYEVQVQVGNVLGMSDQAPVHVFQTAPHKVSVIGSKSAIGSVKVTALLPQLLVLLMLGAGRLLAE